MANDVIGCVLFGLNDDGVENLEQVNQHIIIYCTFFVVDKKTLLFEQVEKAGRSTFSQAWGS
jgi:hypothetical protein